MILLEFLHKDENSKRKRIRAFDDPNLCISNEVYYFRLLDEEDTLENRLALILSSGAIKSYNPTEFHERCIELYQGRPSCQYACRKLFEDCVKRLKLSVDELTDSN